MVLEVTMLQVKLGGEALQLYNICVDPTRDKGLAGSFVCGQSSTIDSTRL
jgi:hypothetical protein